MTSRRSATNPSSRCRVQVLNRQRPVKIDSGSVASFCAEVLCRLGETPWSLSVVFMGPRAIQSLNRNYRGKDYATDVLSFSYEGDNVDGKPLLGEIVIAPSVALEQARRFRTNAETEMRRLLVHGILHLLGHDHDTDQGEMNQVQARLMRQTSRTFHGIVRHDP